MANPLGEHGTKFQFDARIKIPGPIINDAATAQSIYPSISVFQRKISQVGLRL